MKAFKTLFKTEGKLALRATDGIFFGMFIPIVIGIIIGIIFNGKPAFEGAPYSFIDQSFGALVAFTICATGLMGIPLTLADYRFNKILKRFKITPVSPMLLFLIQFIIAFILAVITALLIFLVFSTFFNYEFHGSLIGFVLSYLLLVMAVYGIGLLIASLAPNMKRANLLCNIIYFPMIFLSGATIPYEVMPKPMQFVAEFLPVTQGIKLLKVTSLGLPLENIWFPILLLILIFIVTVGLSIKFFKWE